MQKYRKKPVIIEAQQWDGTYKEMRRLEEELNIIMASASYRMVDNTVSTWRIVTLEGAMEVKKDDWIIVGVKGEVYPCKPDIFEMTYEKVQD